MTSVGLTGMSAYLWERTGYPAVARRVHGSVLAVVPVDRNGCEYLVPSAVYAGFVLLWPASIKKCGGNGKVKARRYTVAGPCGRI